MAPLFAFYYRQDPHPQPAPAPIALPILPLGESSFLKQRLQR